MKKAYVECESDIKKKERIKNKYDEEKKLGEERTKRYMDAPRSKENIVERLTRKRHNDEEEEKSKR